MAGDGKIGTNLLREHVERVRAGAASESPFAIPADRSNPFENQIDGKLPRPRVDAMGRPPLPAAAMEGIEPSGMPPFVTLPREAPAAAPELPAQTGRARVSKMRPKDVNTKARAYERLDKHLRAWVKSVESNHEQADYALGKALMDDGAIFLAAEVNIGAVSDLVKLSSQLTKRSLATDDEKEADDERASLFGAIDSEELGDEKE